MSMPEATPSIADRVRPLEAGASIIAATFLGDQPALVLGEETVVLGVAAPRRIAAHPGAGILCAAGDGARLLTGGDDGRVVETTADGTTRTLHTGTGWIDTLALGPSGSCAWSSGRTVHVAAGKEIKTWQAPSTPGGLAFAPKGMRLAVAHYGGVSLWFPNAASTPDFLAWKGSHHVVTWSPDGRFVVTAMQEPQLHGWRIADAADMRMSGYPGKVRSLSWTATGNGLATSGAESLIVWPFTGKDGPMGKQPAMLVPYPKRITTVACHPRDEIAAVGFEDGLVMLARLKDGAEILVRPPGNGPVTALAWAPKGSTLVFGTEDGAAGIVAL